MGISLYPAKKIKRLLRQERYPEAFRICNRYFERDCYHTANIQYLSQCLFESTLQHFDGDVTPDYLNALLQALRYGAVPKVAFSDFFSAYETFLKKRFQELKDPGKVIMILGTGRNGSTSLAEALKKLPNSLVSHERPPLVYWQDAESQLDFHLRFSKLSRRYFRFVIDASHWWLPHINYLKKSIGQIYVIFLYRKHEDTLKSFIKIKGTGPGSINHWINHNGDYWAKNYWDKCYPNMFDFNNIGSCRSDFCMAIAKEYCVSKYLTMYNNEAQKHVEDENGISLTLETLFANKSKKKLFEFLDCKFEWCPWHLNMGGAQHSWTQTIFN